MSTAAKQTGEALSAEECKGFFEVGTQPLVDEFTAIAACTTPADLQKLYKTFLEERLEDLRLQESAMGLRVTNIQETNSSSDFDNNVEFLTRKAAVLDSIVKNATDISEQVNYVENQLKNLENITDELFKQIKNDAKLFLSTRSKILANWAENYKADPLLVIRDIDGESVAVTADGRDLSSWANSMMSRVASK